MNNNRQCGQQHTDKKQLGIYIHIPFCVKKCAYCDFLSAPASADFRKRYTEALIKEITITLSNDRYNEYEVQTIFFGGGTPSVLEADLICSIMSAVKSGIAVSDMAEISIECNPGTADIDKFKAYKKAGINRISFGLQSANNNELYTIGRIHTYEEFVQSFKIARDAGFDNINVDLMSALPNQTLDSWRQTLSQIIRINPEHISAYSLILEENTVLYDQSLKEDINLPDEDTERQMYYITGEMLSAAGYKQYEISNYAKPGFECRHNLSYWDRVDYVGFGIGAASLFEEVRYTNISDVNKYVDIWEDTSNAIGDDSEIKRTYEDRIHVDISALPKTERMEEYMFLGLRKIEGVSETRFRNIFGDELRDIYSDTINKYIQMGMIEWHGSNLRLTQSGIDVSNVIMSEFILD